MKRITNSTNSGQSRARVTTHNPLAAKRSVYLGQFTDETANQIAEALHTAGIAWHYKQAGAIGKALFAGDWGTRLFVDSEKLEEAKRIVNQVVTQDQEQQDQ